MLSFAPRIGHTALGVVVGALAAGGGYAIAEGAAPSHNAAHHAARTTRKVSARDLSNQEVAAHHNIAAVKTASIRTSVAGVIYACVDNTTHVMTLRTSATAHCRAGSTALRWNVQGKPGTRGATGARGATGTAGAAGVDGKNATSTAWGEVWPGATGTTATSPSLANSSGNVIVIGGAAGFYDLYVSGCSAKGLSEPATVVSANDDLNDSQHPAAKAVTNLRDIGAIVLSWSSVTSGTYDGDLSIIVDTFDSSTDTDVDLDFSFIVDC